MSVAFGWVWVLAKDDYLDLVEGKGEDLKAILLARKDRDWVRFAFDLLQLF